MSMLKIRNNVIVKSHLSVKGTSSSSSSSSSGAGSSTKLLSTLTSDDGNFSVTNQSIFTNTDVDQGGIYSAWHLMDGTKYSDNTGDSEYVSNTNIGWMSAQVLAVGSQHTTRATNSVVYDMGSSKTITSIDFWNYWAKTTGVDTLYPYTVNGVSYSYFDSRRSDIVDVYISNDSSVPEATSTKIVAETNMAKIHEWTSTITSSNNSGRYIRLSIQNNTGAQNGENVVGIHEMEINGY